MPRDYISEDGLYISEAGRRYLAPLILGEDFPPFENGLPKVAKLKKAKVERKLATFEL
jgi:6-phosphofructokinase 1